jgi:hypothetical protein
LIHVTIEGGYSAWKEYGNKNLNENYRLGSHPNSYVTWSYPYDMKQDFASNQKINGILSKQHNVLNIGIQIKWWIAVMQISTDYPYRGGYGSIFFFDMVGNNRIQFSF